MRMVVVRWSMGVVGATSARSTHTTHSHHIMRCYEIGVQSNGIRCGNGNGNEEENEKEKTSGTSLCVRHDWNSNLFTIFI